MQWSAGTNGGFSSADPRRLRSPVIEDGPFGYASVNVADQTTEPASLLNWFRRALHTLRECPEFGVGTCRYLDTGERSALALVYDGPEGAMLALTNLASESRQVSLGHQDEQNGEPREVFADSEYDAPSTDLDDLELAPYGYRWIRLREAAP